jgi:hypothetical protein
MVVVVVVGASTNLKGKTRADQKTVGEKREGEGKGRQNV